MAVTKAPKGEETEQIKTARDAVALTKELGNDSGNDAVTKETNDLNLKVIKGLANDVNISMAEASAEAALARRLRAKTDREEATKEAALKSSSQVSPIVNQQGLPVLPTLPGVGPIGQVSAVKPDIAAILMTLPEDQRVEWLNSHESLLYGGFPGPNIFAGLQPHQQEKKPEADGSLLSGVAALLGTQGQTGNQSAMVGIELFKAMQSMQAQYQRPSNGGDNAGMEKLVGAIQQLATAMQTGQQNLQNQISALKDAANQQQNALYEKLFEAQKEAIVARDQVKESAYTMQLGALQSKLEDISKHASDQPAMLGPLMEQVTQLRNSYMELIKTQMVPQQQGESVDEIRARHEYDIELKKLEAQNQLMQQTHAEKMADAQKFGYKTQALGLVLDTIKSGYDDMKLKKALEKGGSSTAQSLANKVAAT